MITNIATTGCSDPGELIGIGTFNAVAAETIGVYEKAPVDERGTLVHELFRRYSDISALPAAPSMQTLAEALGVGMKLIEHLAPAPQSLNMTASENGEILFTLFGPGREAEIWLGATPGYINCVLVEDGDVADGSLPAADIKPVVAWLAGGARPV